MRLNTWSHLLSGGALAITFTLACASAAYADDPGDLDTTFNGTGIVTDTIGSDTYDGAEAVAIQSDGKIVVAGASYNSPEFNFTVVRYRGDGSLDADFGQGGIVTTSIRGFDVAHAIAIQPGDGKIVAAGEGGTMFDNDFAVVRYQTDGGLDLTFNGTGMVTTSVSSFPSSDYCRAVAIQPDGKIVVAGSSEAVSGSPNITLVRYTDTGALDATFNHTGIVTTSIGNYADAAAVAIQPDDKIVVAGRSGSAFVVVARYTITGSLDASFNGTGIVTTSIGTWARGYAVAIQPDGKIVVAGESSSGFTVVRYNDNGTLDTDFGGTGVITTAISSDGAAYSLRIQPDGKIVAAGSSISEPGSYNFAIVRHNSDGSLDTSFNHTGVVTTLIGSLNSAALSVAIQPDDGKIVAAGAGADPGHWRFVVVRYLGRFSHPYFRYLPVILKSRWW